MEKFWDFGMFNPSIDPTKEGINHSNWNNLTGLSRSILLFVTRGRNFSGYSNSVDVYHKYADKYVKMIDSLPKHLKQIK